MHEMALDIFIAEMLCLICWIEETGIKVSELHYRDTAPSILYVLSGSSSLLCAADHGGGGIIYITLYIVVIAWLMKKQQAEVETDSGQAIKGSPQLKRPINLMKPDTGVRLGIFNLLLPDIEVMSPGTPNLTEVRKLYNVCIHN